MCIITFDMILTYKHLQQLETAHKEGWAVVDLGLWASFELWIIIVKVLDLFQTVVFCNFMQIFNFEIKI